jgi:hypothetical protein
MTRQLTWLMTMTITGAAACAGDATPIPTATDEQAATLGLHIDEATSTDVSGGYDTPEVRIWFAAHAEWRTTVRSSFVVGNVPIDVVYDAERGDGGELTIEVGGALDGPELQTLLDLATALDGAFPYERDAVQPGGAMLRTFAGLFGTWTLGPTREPMRVNIRPKEQEPITNGGTGPGGPTPPPTPPPTPTPTCPDIADDDFVMPLPWCCNGGTTVAWDHDGPNECFNRRFNTCGDRSAGSGEALATNCPGRCGPNCTSIPYYTQDCLEHDFCLMHDPGQQPLQSTGSCGDELFDAVDDFAFVYGATIGWAPGFLNFPLHTRCFF